MAYATLRGAKIQNIIIISTCGMKIIYEKNRIVCIFQLFMRLFKKTTK